MMLVNKSSYDKWHKRRDSSESRKVHIYTKTKGGVPVTKAHTHTKFKWTV